MTDLLAILLPALAMGLGWGIRGQFGHQSGAMVPGALVGLALGAVSLREPSSAQVLRLAAVAALGCSIGGVMTYGQTLGLVHDQPRSPTRWWGLLGVAVKGSVWIGLTGAFIGMAGSGVAYRPGELALLTVALAMAARLGVLLVNRPHRPPEALPRIYFSKRADPKPRPEFWGGLWLALLCLLAYLWFLRGDSFAVALAGWGVLGGAIGFAGGEWLQMWGTHARPFGDACQRWMDWWKVMEVSFGAVAGAALGLGWRRLEAGADAFAVVDATLPAALEVGLLIVWTAWFVAAECYWRPAESVWELSFIAIVLPMVGVFGGRLWPAFVVLPMLVWASGDNVVHQWTTRHRLMSARLAWPLLLGLTLVASFIAWRWVIGEADAPAWLTLVAWVQTALTVLWAFGTRPVAQARVGVSRLLAAGSALPVEASFVVMAAVVTALAHLPR